MGIALDLGLGLRKKKKISRYAGKIAGKVEGFVEGQLNKKNPGSNKIEKATESLGRVTGKRKALFIGINYKGQSGELRGCINDVYNIRDFLKSKYRIDEEIILTDDTSDPKNLPTRANILAGFKWLRSGANAGDSLILHYSGHGGSVKDLDGDEEDGFDETLIPLDNDSAGHIVDDEVHDVLVRGLPRGVRLTAIMDCCHSESILDLPYTYNVRGDLQIVENSKNEGISKLVGGAVMLALGGKKKEVISGVTDGIKLLMKGDKGGNSKARKKTEKTRSTDADVIMFSGCKDSQTSADAHIDGEATGAMSYALIKTLKANKNMDYTNLLREMRKVLSGEYSQVPMLSAGKKLILEHPFQI